MRTDFTTWSLPSDVACLVQALHYARTWERACKRLPASFPAKVRKAYAARLREAVSLVVHYAGDQPDRANVNGATPGASSVLLDEGR